jgi:uncharacterized protein (DUF433 family)
MPAKRKQPANAAVQQIGRYIVADPQICHGKLTFRGTRILVADVLTQVAEGMSWEAIAADWRGSLPPQAITEAVHLARESFLTHAAEFVPPKHQPQRKAG